ncbi:MAG: DMT family transporter [Mycobacterium sp.]|nr:DMT family transporter [Mycobacterium sp.]
MEHDSAIIQKRLPLQSGVGWGLLGVMGFSLTVPLTRVAVDGGHLPALFVGAGRAVIAGLLALLALSLTRQQMPTARQWIRLAIVAGGIVVGFPLLTSFALTTTEASHGAVIIAVLPAATAIAVVLRTHEPVTKIFWTSASLGAAAAITFAYISGGGIGGFGWPDLLLFGAVVAAAIGYAEGGLLARELGAWQTTCWALVLALPVMTMLTGFTIRAGLPDGDLKHWSAFAYLALISMFLAFFAWYRGLALGPMSTVSQIQLVQPVLSICWAALLLGEHITPATALGGLAVIACATLAVRVRNTARPSTTTDARASAHSS